MGWFSDSLFGKKKTLDEGKIADRLQPWQSMISEQADQGRQMMDPNSQWSKMQRGNIMSQGATAGQSAAAEARKLAAMTGMSPAQAMAQSRQAMLGGTSQASQNWLSQMSANMNQGAQMFSGAMQAQGQHSENMAQAYINKVQAHNQARSANMQMTAGLISGVAGAFSDMNLKENIELVGKSPDGHNIYEFDYINKIYGEGRYRGVMDQEVPKASVKHSDGYLWVDYNKVDVNFERIG